MEFLYLTTTFHSVFPKLFFSPLKMMHTKNRRHQKQDLTLFFLSSKTPLNAKKSPGSMFNSFAFIFHLFYTPRNSHLISFLIRCLSLSAFHFLHDHHLLYKCSSRAFFFFILFFAARPSLIITRT